MPPELDVLPDTPAFFEDLERQLREEAARPSFERRLRLPVPTRVLRPLTNLSWTGLHMAFAVGIATALLLIAPGRIHEEASLVATPPPAPGYIAQYANPAPTRTADLVANARSAGYEVNVRHAWVGDPDMVGKVIRMSHSGRPTAHIPVDGPARGPLLIVVGLSLGQGSTAN